MSQLIVQKFGGTCVGSTEKLHAIARRIVATRRQGHDLVVVVSAMGHTTDRLLELAREIATDPHRRELDMLLATGEITSAALLALAIRGLGEDAVALSGGQCGILTNDVHANARILRIDPLRVRQELARGAVVVAAGYQGISPKGDVTTLGRGGSDTTATALAAALGADLCQIFTDVDCVYSADPRVVPGAQPIPEMHSQEMEELAWHGAQVVKAEAVEFAKSNGVDFEVLSPFGAAPGTRIRVGKGEVVDCDDEVFVPHRPAVAGVAGRTDLVRLRSVGPRSESSAPAPWHDVFTLVAGYDLVFGRLDGKAFDILLSDLEIPDPEALRQDLRAGWGESIAMEVGLGAVSLIGFGLGSRPASLLDAFRVLQKAGIAVRDSFTGRESLSFLVDAAQVIEGVKLLHTAFVETQCRPTAHELSTGRGARNATLLSAS